jgi:Tol biopolymer transport system component
MRTRWISGALGLPLVMMLTSCTNATLISVSSSNQQGNGESAQPVIGAGGRYVAFNSNATNLVPNDTNGPETFDAFVRDTVTNTTSRADLSSTGAQLASIAGGGEGMSDNGRYVVFTSNAPNVVPNMPNNYEVFLRDLTLGTTTVVSHTAAGDPTATGNSHGFAISPDGRFVLFESTASDLAGQSAPARDTLYRYNRHTGKIVKIATPDACALNTSSLSIATASAAWSTGVVAYSTLCSNRGLTASGTVYVKPPHAPQMVLDSGGAEQFAVSLDMATDGSVLAYTMYVFDVNVGESAVLKLWTGSGTPTEVSTPGGAFAVNVSGSGRYVAYTTEQDYTNTPNGDFYEGTRRVVILDRSTNQTALASANLVGALPNGNSDDPALSNDGTTVGFSSQATDIVPNDTNNQDDVFTRPIADVFAGSTAGTVRASG